MGEVTLIEDKSKLTENKAQEIEKLYLPMVETLKALESEFNDIVVREINPETTRMARELRIKLKNTRVSADKVRKKAKENIIIEGNAIQSAYNTFLYATKTKEDKLSDIENHLQKLEEIRIANLKDERESELKKYTDNIPSNLGEFTDEVWNDYITGVELKHKQKIKQEEEEKKAKEEEEQRAKVKQERRELLLPIWQHVPEEVKTMDLSTMTNEEFEQKREEAKQVKQEEDRKQEEIKAENEKLKKEKEERDKKQAEKDRKAKEEQDELKRKLAEKEKVEKDNQRRKKEEEEMELMKGDEDKVSDMIADFETIKTKYTFRSQKNNKKYSEVKTLIDKVINHIKN